MAITGSSNDKTTKIASMIIFLLLLGLAEQASAFSCPKVYMTISSCISFFRTGQSLSPECCEEIQEVKDLVSTADDCQQLCTCGLILYKINPGVQPGYVNEALNKCGVNCGFQFSPSMDCSKVKCA